VFVALGALSHQHERAWSASIFYIALGALAGLGLHILGIRAPDPVRDHVLLERLAEPALAIAVLGAGLAIDVSAVPRRSLVTIAGLLFAVLPLTVAAVAGWGVLAMGLSLGAALVLGAALAPTDPVLAGDVGLGPPGEDDQSEPRLSLHTEAGANDGLAAPLVLLGLVVAAGSGLGGWVVADVLYAMPVALVVGAAAGTGVAALVVRLRDRGMLAQELDGFVALGMALAIYGGTEALDAYGLLAVFAAGVTFRRYESSHEVNHSMHRGAEIAGRLLELVVLMLLGAMLSLDGLRAPGPAGWALIVALLLVIRPVLVFATTARSELELRQRLFLGLLGVRGVAALFYVAFAVADGALGEDDERVVVWTALACVTVSVVAHGMAASPLASRLISSSSRG
jgi:NhaP-type Na+/H+ or K+/H+ antiporter